jgi:malonyl-CoA O-methyltransferase
MAPPPQTVQHRFSAAAASYDDHAVAQRTAADRLLAELPSLPKPSRILEVGCGTGHLTAQLHQRFPRSPIDALDRSPKMIQQARTRLPHATNITWHAGDLLTFAPPQRYPLIVSSAALHWIEPLTDAFHRLYGLAALKAHLACVVMLNGTLGELRDARLRVAPDKPPLGRLPSAADAAEALGTGGFQATHCRVEQVTLHYPSADTFLRAVHDMGLTGGRVSRGPAPLNRIDLARLRKDYEDHYTDPALGVRATYRFLLVHAQAT